MIFMLQELSTLFKYISFVKQSDLACPALSTFYCPRAGDIALQQCMLGMEFSGRDPNGHRVMGLLPAKGLATCVDADKRFLWDVPSSW